MDIEMHDFDSSDNESHHSRAEEPRTDHAEANPVLPGQVKSDPDNAVSASPPLNFHIRLPVSVPSQSESVPVRHPRSVGSSYQSPPVSSRGSSSAEIIEGETLSPFATHCSSDTLYWYLLFRSADRGDQQKLHEYLKLGFRNYSMAMNSRVRDANGRYGCKLHQLTSIDEIERELLPWFNTTPVSLLSLRYPHLPPSHPLIKGFDFLFYCLVAGAFPIFVLFAHHETNIAKYTRNIHRSIWYVTFGGSYLWDTKELTLGVRLSYWALSSVVYLCTVFLICIRCMLFINPLRGRSLEAIETTGWVAYGYSFADTWFPLGVVLFLGFTITSQIVIRFNLDEESVERGAANSQNQALGRTEFQGLTPRLAVGAAAAEQAAAPLSARSAAFRPRTDLSLHHSKTKALLSRQATRRISMANIVAVEEQESGSQMEIRIKRLLHTKMNVYVLHSFTANAGSESARLFFQSIAGRAQARPIHSLQPSKDESKSVIQAVRYRHASGVAISILKPLQFNEFGFLSRTNIGLLAFSIIGAFLPNFTMYFYRGRTSEAFLGFCDSSTFTTCDDLVLNLIRLSVALRVILCVATYYITALILLDNANYFSHKSKYRDQLRLLMEHELIPVESSGTSSHERWRYDWDLNRSSQWNWEQMGRLSTQLHRTESWCELNLEGWIEIYQFLDQQDEAEKWRVQLTILYFAMLLLVLWGFAIVGLNAPESKFYFADALILSVTGIYAVVIIGLFLLFVLWKGVSINAAAEPTIKAFRKKLFELKRQLTWYRRLMRDHGHELDEIPEDQRPDLQYFEATLPQLHDSVDSVLNYSEHVLLCEPFCVWFFPLTKATVAAFFATLATGIVSLLANTLK